MNGLASSPNVLGSTRDVTNVHLLGSLPDIIVVQVDDGGRLPLALNSESLQLLH